MIAVVEDEKELCESLKMLLTEKGYEIVTARSCDEADKYIGNPQIDMFLLDVKLPDGSGFDICRKIRKSSEVPVIFLTSCDNEDEIVTGLDIGADDYITKPFHIKELVARVKVVLKRKVNIENTDILEYDDLKLDIRTGKMSANGNEISINGKELDLLETLLLNKTQIVNREILANKIWGYDSETEYNNVEVYMSFLRKKLKLIKSNVKIKAIRGIGYKLEAENDKKIK